MGEKINNILKGEIISSVFYILLGLCLILIPAQTVDVICKVVFGLILIGAGIYHIYIYIRGKAKATIMDLLSGVVVFVLPLLWTDPINKRFWSRLHFETLHSDNQSPNRSPPPQYLFHAASDKGDRAAC